MAHFNESKIISALHWEHAEIGKKYIFADDLVSLQSSVLSSTTDFNILEDFSFSIVRPFKADNGHGYQFLYPYEEPTRVLMTKRQLAEWLAKGNGQYRLACGVYAFHMDYIYECGEDDYRFKEEDGITIRSWGSNEWVDPSLEIYERDCK